MVERDKPVFAVTSFSRRIRSVVMVVSLRALGGVRLCANGRSNQPKPGPSLIGFLEQWAYIDRVRRGVGILPVGNG